MPYISINIAPRVFTFVPYSKVTQRNPEQPSDLTFELSFKVKFRSKGQNLPNMPSTTNVAPRAFKLSIQRKAAPRNSITPSD